MRRERTPRTAEEHINSMTNRIERLEKRLLPTNGVPVYVQPEQPVGPTGALWFDTDEPCS